MAVVERSRDGDDMRPTPAGGGVIARHGLGRKHEVLPALTGDKGMRDGCGRWRWWQRESYPRRAQLSGVVRSLAWGSRTLFLQSGHS